MRTLLLFILLQTLIADTFSQNLLTPVWTKVKYSSVGGIAESWAVDVDASGFVYWVANSDSTATQGRDIYCYKFDSNGNPIWTTPLFYGGIVSGYNNQQGYVCNAQDTFVYIGGRNHLNNFNSDMLLLKVDKTNASLQWAKQYPFGIGGYDEMDGLEIRNDGIYCGGWAHPSDTAANIKIDVGLMKLNFNGDTIWTNCFGQNTTGEHQDGHFVVDSNSIFAAGLWDGKSIANACNGSGFLGKFSKTNGALIDSTLFGYQSNNFGDKENALGMTSDGTYLYVTGYTTPTIPNDMQIMVAKFDKNLNLLWFQDWGGTSAETARGIVVNNGKIFIAGVTNSSPYNPNGGADAVLLVYDTTGNFITYKTWGDTLDNEFRGIAISGNDLYLAGTSGYNIFSGGTPDTGFVMKIDINSVVTSVNENSNQQLSSMVYPNPFSLQTTLQTNNILNNATLTVYNSFGQTVKEIINISGQTVTFSRDNLPSGLYFVRLTQDNNQLETKKLIITD